MTSQIADAIRVLFPSATFGIGGNVRLQDDGAGPYIKAWGLPGNQPTELEIAAATAQVPAALLASKRAAAKAILDGDTDHGREQRALVALLVSELNILRVAMSLAPRTTNQVTTAIKGAIDQEN